MSWVGKALARKEDHRLLRGRGRFTADVRRPGLLHAAFARSPLASARIGAVRAPDALAVRGVHAVLDAGTLGCADVLAALHRPEFVPTAMPVLARDRVRYAGEPFAIVLAEDAYAAEDGAELVAVDQDPIEALASMPAALAGAPLHEGLTANTFLDVFPFEDPEIERVFAGAHTVELEFRSARVAALPMEGRACLAEWDEREDQLVVTVSTQVPHQVRTAIAESLRLPERQVRVLAPDVGGGFGLKCVVGREEIAVAAAAYRTGHAVAWSEDRVENLTASFHGHEQRHRVRAAFDEQGRLLALDADIRCDVGAYSAFPFTSGVEPLMAATELPGAYRVPRYRARARGIATNKPPTAPYRGVSRPQIVAVMEGVMTEAGRQLGIDPLEVRRRNLITEFPYTGVNGITYDPGSYSESLDRCAELLASEERGPLRGIGFACFNERTGYGTEAFAARKMEFTPGYEIANARMDPSGTVTVTTGTSAHGQGHETTLAQVTADRLGLHPDQVRVRQGDTEATPYGWGTFGSRSAMIGGSAVRLAADRLAERIRRIAAHLLEVTEEEIELDQGSARARGKAITLADLARLSHFQAHRLPKGVEFGLEVQAGFDVSGSGTFSNATHGVVVELDPETGAVRIPRYVVVEDCGTVLNPSIVDGQVRGGVAQGIGAALYERLHYEENGQPGVASLMDYLAPTAQEIPDIEIHHLETPCLFNETGAKGMGEGGTIGAPAAVLNAVNDALSHTGVRITEIPIRAETIRRALEGACTIRT